MSPSIPFLQSLKDFRLRHAQYRTDPDLQALTQAIPMIPIWLVQERKKRGMKLSTHRNRIPLFLLLRAYALFDRDDHETMNDVYAYGADGVYEYDGDLDPVDTFGRPFYARVINGTQVRGSF